MRPLLALSCALMVVVATSSLARAQDADTERARALFAEGTAFADQGQWQQAAARFRATLQLRQSPAVAYNLAVALEQLGELAEASTLLDSVIADPEAARDMKRLARRLRQTIEPRLGHVVIHLEADLAGARVRLDYTEVSAERIGQSIAVDPGAHAVVLLRGGREVERQQTTVAAGATETVTIGRRGAAAPTPRQTAQTVVQHEPERPPEDEESSGGSVFTRWWFWTLLVAVAVGTTAGVLIATSGTPDPVQGNLMPGVIQVEVP